MKGGTLFSGIGAPELAAPEIDWRWCAEIDPFACALLAQRFPKTRNLGDVTRIDPDEIEPVDLVVFGSPCQSFSVAGNRLGLADARGNLALVALGLVGRIRPRWVVFENVPGLLLSGAGRDFGAILGALAKCGYGFAYRILDAQYAGVPQRRRRVFIVGCLGDWRAAAAVLFECQGMRWDPPARPQAAERIAAALEGGTSGSGGWRPDFLAGGGMAVPLLDVGTRNSASADRARCGLGIGAPGEPMFALQRGKQHGVAFGIDSDCLDRSGEGANGSAKARSGLGIALDIAQAVRAKRPGGVVATLRSKPQPGGPCHPLASTAHPPAIVADPLSANGYTYTHEGCTFRLRNCVGMPPRRLTPRECERLQGLPDDWTAVTYRGKPAADGPRYRAIGNSMAVPVVRWLLLRIPGPRRRAMRRRAAA